MNMTGDDVGKEKKKEIGQDWSHSPPPHLTQGIPSITFFVEIRRIDNAQLIFQFLLSIHGTQT